MYYTPEDKANWDRVVAMLEPFGARYWELAQGVGDT